MEMKTAILFDTAYGSLNLGDFIIQEAVQREMQDVLDGYFCVRYPTHTPVSFNMQSILPVLSTRTCRQADLKFICGTNIVKNTFLRFARDWSVNQINAGLYRGAVLLGCGRELNAPKLDAYTIILYKRILSREYTHSVRDDRTAEFLDSLGFKVAVTGCPTTWGLDNEAIAKAYKAPEADGVIVTLTDYATDPEHDRKLIEILRTRYSRVLFWPQGSRDFEYAKQLGILESVEIIPPNFDAYARTVGESGLDYVGTRLHGGVYALRNGCRTLILSVDNRAADMAVTTGLPVLPRTTPAQIEEHIHAWPTPHVRIPHQTINEWKRQFA